MLRSARVVVRGNTGNPPPDGALEKLGTSKEPSSIPSTGVLMVHGDDNRGVRAILRANRRRLRDFLEQVGR